MFEKMANAGYSEILLIFQYFYLIFIFVVAVLVVKIILKVNTQLHVIKESVHKCCQGIKESIRHKIERANAICHRITEHIRNQRAQSEGHRQRHFRRIQYRDDQLGSPALTEQYRDGGDLQRDGG